MTASKNPSRPQGDRDAIARLLDLIFLTASDKVAEMLASHEAMIEDCLSNGGRSTLWPLSLQGDIAVAAGPDGRSLTLRVEESDDAIAFRLDEAPDDLRPVCCWAGTLRSGIHENFVSPPLFLPERWLEEAGARDLAHALGSGSKEAIDSDELALPEIGLGFVIASTEAEGRRTSQLQIFGRSDFAGHAVVELQFLDEDDQRIDVEPAIRPQLIELRPIETTPDFRPARRVTLALGEIGVVSAECEWEIPAKLEGIHRCRIALRPVEPEEALRLARRPVPMPFLPGDDEATYSARRKKSDLALPDEGDRVEYGFLLSVADRKAMRERLYGLVSRTIERHGGEQAVAENAETLGSLLISVDNAIQRGADDLILVVAEEEHLLRRLFVMSHNATCDFLRAQWRWPVKLDAVDVADWAETPIDSAQNQLEECMRYLSELFREIGSEGFLDLREALVAAYETWESRQARPKTKQGRILAMLMDGDSIETIAAKLGSSKGAVQKMKDRLLKDLKRFFGDQE